jgi:hypothetical protein
MACCFHHRMRLGKTHAVVLGSQLGASLPGSYGGKDPPGRMAFLWKSIVGAGLHTPEDPPWFGVLWLLEEPHQNLMQAQNCALGGKACALFWKTPKVTGGARGVGPGYASATTGSLILHLPASHPAELARGSTAPARPLKCRNPAIMSADICSSSWAGIPGLEPPDASFPGTCIGLHASTDSWERARAPTELSDCSVQVFVPIQADTGLAFPSRTWHLRIARICMCEDVS